MILNGQKISERFKTQQSFLAASMILILLPFASHFLGTDAVKFWACFFLLLIFGAFNGVLQGQVFGMAATMPFEYMGAVMFGNGISGVAMNSLRAVLQLILPGTENLFTVAFLFFILAATILWACAFTYNAMYSSPVYLYYQRKGGKAKSSEEQ